MQKHKILHNSISNHDYYCEGIWGRRSINSYILGIQLLAAKSEIKLSHPGSIILDKINCFDMAEVSDANLGQINMIKVSSFCGPLGLIWGYDICPAKKEIYSPIMSAKRNSIPVYDIKPLTIAFQKLLGTVELPRFPFLPGSHVPCAAKYLIKQGPCLIYTAEGIGIPEDRAKQACLLMEDVGYIPLNIKNIVEYKIMILENLVSSILSIGENQRICYKEIFIGIKEIKVKIKEIGCVLAASPYFTIAKNAMPESGDIINLNINQWEDDINSNYLYKNGIS